MHFENSGISIPKSRLLTRLDEIHDGWVFVDGKKVRRVLEKLDEEHLRYWTVLEPLKSGITLQKQ